MKKIKNIKFIYILIFLSLILKLSIFFHYSDTKIVNEWAYLLHNYNFSGTLGYNIVINEYLAEPAYAKEGDIVLPSVYMPPLYFFFIYIIQFISGTTEHLAQYVIFIQILLSLFSIYYFYKLIEKFQNGRRLHAITTIFAFFPIAVYASIQISSMTLQLFLIIMYLFFYNKLRGEFIVFYLFSIIYLFVFYRVQIKNLLITLVITSLFISPYLLRNYQNFNTLVLTKSFGYNLLKGNYKNFKVEGNPYIISEEFKIEDIGIRADKYFEIKLDDFYKEKAFSYIKDNPKIFIQNYFKKALSYFFIDLYSTYPNYYNVLHVVPKLLISILSFFGIFFLIKKRGFFQYISLFYVINILFFSIFFILPRYGVMILPLQIILSIESLKFLKRKIFD